MTDDLFRADAYLRTCEARILRIDEAGIVLDRTVFYPLGGGQAGDAGVLALADGREVVIADTRKAKNEEGQPTNEFVHVPAPEQAELLAALKPGDTVTARLDWERRHRLMRFHTASHLLCHLVPVPVNGCSITPDYARIDFHMTDPLDKEALTAGLARLVEAAHPLTVGAITDEELDANPALVKSMSVQPPRGTGTVRTIRIGGEGKRRSTSSPAAARMLRTPPRSGPWSSPRSRRKAPTAGAWCWAGRPRQPDAPPELSPAQLLRLTA
jgi:misacylated tRNA(Ala) deacylase